MSDGTLVPGSSLLSRARPGGSLITEQELAEANTVTSKGAGHQFEIQLGHLCNNRCVFCSSGQLTEMRLAKPIPLDPMIAAIEDARAQGARRITFLGGEPTLHKGFLAALARTVELGFPEVVIFTDGVLLPQQGFVDKVLALSRDIEWRISIQGGNEAAHVAVTLRKHSWQRIVEGLAILQAQGQHVTANVCVNERSYRSLPDYPALVEKYGLRQLHVDIVRPASTGERSEEYLRDIMPRYSLMAPYFRQMLERFDRDAPDFDVNIGNLPFCILPDGAHRIHHGGQETITKACDADALEAPVDKYAWHESQRRHPPQCAACAFRPSCTGVFSKYLELYGDEEFQPISVEHLRALDPAQRNFVLLVAPALAPLLVAAEAQPPEHWQLEEVTRDARERRVDLRLREAHGGRVTLRFLPPAGRSISGVAAVEHLLLSTEGFQVAAVVDAEVSGPSLRALCAWMASRLDEAPGATPIDRAALGAALDLVEEKRSRETNTRSDGSAEPDESRRRRAAQLLRDRARVQQLIGRVQRRERFGAWRYAGSRADEDGLGSTVKLGSPGGGVVELCFRIDARAERSRVSLDFRFGDGTDEQAARPVVEALIELLRDPAPPVR